MKDLRFRVLDKENNKLEYGGLGFAAQVNNRPRYSKPMQFTGVTDHNGKAIYEGDVVKMLCGCSGIVEYGDCAFIINIVDIGSTKERHSRVWHNSFCGMFAWYQNCRVVGNIHNALDA